MVSRMAAQGRARPVAAGIHFRGRHEWASFDGSSIGLPDSGLLDLDRLLAIRRPADIAPARPDRPKDVGYRVRIKSPFGVATAMRPISFLLRALMLRSLAEFGSHRRGL